MPSPPAVDAERRMLLVHAHPDDETIGQGASMAKYAAEGARVTLVTCTRGEMGQVLVPGLEHLAFELDGGLGAHRVAELAEAMRILGVEDHRFLGGEGRFHDSGMAWDETGAATVAPDVPAGAFWHADLTEASDLLVAVIREVRPQVLVTYDERGAYGHPDHVQAHRVAMYASLTAAVPKYRTDLGDPWEVTKIYWGGSAESDFRDFLRRLREAGDTETFEGMDPDGDLPPFVTPDHLLTTCVDARDHAGQKIAALRAHATQVEVDGPFFALLGTESRSEWGREHYRLVKGRPGEPDRETGWETDLFAGLVDGGPG